MFERYPSMTKAEKFVREDSLNKIDKIQRAESL